MSENDFRKQLLLNEFKTLSKGKNKEEIVPLIFALSQKAKQAGIQFTRQDCELIYKQIVPGSNPPEGWYWIPWNVDFLLLSYRNGIRTTISRGWRHRGSAATLGLLSGMFGIQCLVCLITKLCKIYPDIYNLKIIPSIILLLYFHYSKYIIISTSNCPFSYDLIIEPSYLSTILFILSRP